MDHSLDLSGFRLSFYGYPKRLPFEVPSHWILFNAPRPLAGDISEQGEWHHGIFYSAVSPMSKWAPRDIQQNRILDATILVLGTVEAFARFGAGCIPEHYRKAYEKADQKTAHRAALYYADLAMAEMDYYQAVEALR